LTLALTFVDSTAGAPERTGLQPAEREREVRRSIERALSLDPDLGLAHAALASLDLYTWRWTESLAAYRVAASKTPGEIVGFQFYAMLTAYAGNPDEGMSFAERGLRLNPDSGTAYQLLGIMRAYTHDFDTAFTRLQRAQQLLPTSPLVSNWLAYVEIARGNTEEALAHLEFTKELLGGEVPVAFLQEFMYAYHRLGRPDEVERLYMEFEAVAANRTLGAGTWAMSSIAIGAHDKAIEWLEVAAAKAARHEVVDGFYALMNLKMNYTNDPLLNEPRFIEAFSNIKGD
jgi:Flp pilus assembly protein TadD